jgi:D-sedoheptulose 7-phosphate isomerase
MIDLRLQPYQNYVADLNATLQALPWEDIHQVSTLLHEARVAQKQIFIVGNGGSAATASHMACDLNKNTQAPGYPHFRVISLTDNLAHFSASANDCGYENVFAEQLSCLIREGDILIAISTSGNSMNVLRAVEVANSYSALTIGWTGAKGGQLAKIVDMAIRVPSDCIEQIEDVHLIMEHMLTKTLRELAQQTISSGNIVENGRPHFAESHFTN